MLLEPLLLLPIGRHRCLNDGPELCRMVGDLQMGQLMHDHIIYRCTSGEEETRTEVQAASSAATTPVARIVFVGDIAIAEAKTLLIDFGDTVIKGRLKCTGKHTTDQIGQGLSFVGLAPMTGIADGEICTDNLATGTLSIGRQQSQIVAPIDGVIYTSVMWHFPKVPMKQLRLLGKLLLYPACCPLHGVPLQRWSVRYPEIDLLLP